METGGGTGSGGAWAPGAMTVLTGAPAAVLTSGAGVVLRDMGKTIVGAAVAGNTLAGTSRVFRKVQILNRTSTLAMSVNSNGVTGGDNTVVPPYYTCYIELPSAGSSGLTAAGSASAAPVAYMPGLPVF